MRILLTGGSANGKSTYAEVTDSDNNILPVTTDKKVIITDEDNSFLVDIDLLKKVIKNKDVTEPLTSSHSSVVTAPNSSSENKASSNSGNSSSQVPQSSQSQNNSDVKPNTSNEYNDEPQAPQTPQSQVQVDPPIQNNPIVTPSGGSSSNTDNKHLNYKSITVKRNSMVNLTLVNANSAVYWSTSNSSVLQDYGLGNFKAIKSGSVVVTASCDGKSYQCTVTVN